MFTGYTEKTIEFMWGIRLNNNREWFTAHKQDYLDRVRRRSLLDTGVEVTTRDELLTLSTCLYDFAGERLVVVARRLREGETAASFAALPVARSASPEMPAIWNQLYG